MTTNYTYNALGELVKKSTGLYVYDEAGHILGQYTTSGALTSEIVWLGDTPVATLRPASGGGVEVFYIHTDHLNTPRVVTQPSNNALRWRWDANPFGGPANDNPSGLGSFILDLRFPGQIAMPESGLYQNDFRDYDYQTGRYVQSDPIGLKGGLNTYGYVSGNPIAMSDPTGLFAPLLVVPAVEGAIMVIGGLVAIREAHRVKEETDIQQEAANDPDFDDKGCPPDCKKWRQALNGMYHAISKLSSLRGVDRAYVDLRWEQFRIFVKRYEQVCGPYMTPPSFHEIYTR